jgi:hypothetical protein
MEFSNEIFYCVRVLDMMVSVETVPDSDSDMRDGVGQ